MQDTRIQTWLLIAFSKLKYIYKTSLNVRLKLSFISYNCFSSYQDNEVFGGTVNFAIRGYGLGDVLHGEGCGSDVGWQLYHQVTFTALKGPAGAWLHLRLSTVTTLYQSTVITLYQSTITTLYQSTVTTLYQCHTIGKDYNGLFLLSNSFMNIFT